MLTGDPFTGQQGALLLVPRKGLDDRLERYFKDGFDVEHFGQKLPFYFYYSFLVESRKKGEEAFRRYRPGTLEVSYEDFKEKLHSKRQILSKAEERLLTLAGSHLQGEAYYEEVTEAHDVYNTQNEGFQLQVKTLLRLQGSDKELAKKFSFGKARFEAQAPSALAVKPTKEELKIALRTEDSYELEKLAAKRLFKRKPTQISARNKVKGHFVRRF